MRMARGIKATASNRRRESSSLPLLLRVGVATVVGGIVLLVVLQCILYDHLVINDEISSINNIIINEQHSRKIQREKINNKQQQQQQQVQQQVQQQEQEQDGNGKDSNSNSQQLLLQQVLSAHNNNPRIRRKHHKFCDNDISFREKCDLQQANCIKHVNASSTHGIGNAIICSFERTAEEVFNANNNHNLTAQKNNNQNCAPAIHSTSIRNNEFDFLKYNRIPNVTTTNHLCTVYAITQPKEIVQTKINELMALDDDDDDDDDNEDKEVSLADDPELPLVAIHIRTGWADEMARNSDSTWNSLEFLDICRKYNNQKNSRNNNNLLVYNLEDDDDPYHYDQAVTTETRSLADDILVPLRKRANTKFGKKKWRLYVASDAPGIKLVIANYLSGEYYKNALMTTGSIGHNHDGVTSRTTKENEEVETNVFVDLIMMSESSLFTFIGSKFPQVAAKRSMCEQEILPAGGSGMPRHTLVGLRNVLSELIKSSSKKSDSSNNNNNNKNKYVYNYEPEQYKKWLETITKLLTNVNHPPPNCLSSLDASLDIDHPVEQCLCWVKRAHAGVSVSVDVDVDVGVDGQ